MLFPNKMHTYNILLCYVTTVNNLLLTRNHAIVGTLMITKILVTAPVISVDDLLLTGRFRTSNQFSPGCCLPASLSLPPLFLA